MIYKIRTPANLDAGSLIDWYLKSQFLGDPEKRICAWNSHHPSGRYASYKKLRVECQELGTHNQSGDTVCGRSARRQVDPNPHRSASPIEVDRPSSMKIQQTEL
jgi:hypothetical protein